MPDVFISYVSSDEAKVRLLYEDLTRSAIEVWEFQTTVRYDIHFVEEFKRQILASAYFLLIDTRAARMGQYLREEVGYARENGKRITICRLEEEISDPPLFEDQEFIRRFDMWQEEYRRGVRKLCKHLGKEYVPCFTEPIDQDFVKEMASIKMRLSGMDSGAKTDQWREFYSEYEEFREKGDVAVDRLQGIIRKTKDLGLCLLTPYLVLGDIFAREARHEMARDTYREATGYFPADPRSYAGLGGASYFLKEWRSSAEGYLCCYEILQKTDEPQHKEKCEMIANNLLESILEGSLDREFEGRIDDIWRRLGHLPRFEAMKGKHFYYKGNFTAAAPLLERAYCQLKTVARKGNIEDALFLAVVMLELATVFGQLGEFYKMRGLLQEGISFFHTDWKAMKEQQLQACLPEMIRLLGQVWLNGEGDILAAIDAYKEAAAIGDSIKFEAELALLYNQRFPQRLREVLDRAYLREDKIEGGEQFYYMGLVYFLDLKPEVAQNYYRRSGKLGWPYYSKLVG